MPTTESLWFKIVVIFMTVATIGVTITNVIHFNRLRSGTCSSISNGTASLLFWINIILLVIAVIIFVLTIWKIISPSKCSCDTNGMKKGVPPGTTQLAYTHTGQHVILPSGPVTSEATSAELSANIVAPNERELLAQQVQYF